MTGGLRGCGRPGRSLAERIDALQIPSLQDDPALVPVSAELYLVEAAWQSTAEEIRELVRSQVRHCDAGSQIRLAQLRARLDRLGAERAGLSELRNQAISTLARSMLIAAHALHEEAQTGIAQAVAALGDALAIEAALRDKLARAGFAHVLPELVGTTRALLSGLAMESSTALTAPAMKSGHGEA